MVRRALLAVFGGLVVPSGWGCGEPPSAEEPSGSLPAGFELRLDRANRDPANFSVRSTAEGIAIETGPSGILYRTDDVVRSGDYALRATFTEVAAPRGHREGFGLFFGGRDLQGPNQRYTYFLVRADGRYLIKRRMGDSTANVSDGWVEAASVATAGNGDVLNDLRIEVAGDTVHFHCNGAELAALSAAEVEPYGIAGIRVNHNLDLRVTGFAITR